MKDNDYELKQDIWKRFTKQQNVFFATVEGNQPRVRPVTLIRLKNRLFFATGLDNAKVKQIMKHPKTEFCLMFGRKGNRGTVRAECVATLVNDKGVKADVYNNVPFFSEFWKTPEEPSYALIELRLVSFEYYQPGSMKAIRVKS